jgi:hypothetical protein
VRPGAEGSHRPGPGGPICGDEQGNTWVLGLGGTSGRPARRGRPRRGRAVDRSLSDVPNPSHQCDASTNHQADDEPAGREAGEHDNSAK